MPKFFGRLFRSAVLVNKKSLFLQNANVLNFNCFLGCIYTVYHIVYIVFLAVQDSSIGDIVSH